MLCIAITDALLLTCVLLIVGMVGEWYFTWRFWPLDAASHSLLGQLVPLCKLCCPCLQYQSAHSQWQWHRKMAHPKTAAMQQMLPCTGSTHILKFTLRSILIEYTKRLMDAPDGYDQLHNLIWVALKFTQAVACQICSGLQRQCVGWSLQYANCKRLITTSWTQKGSPDIFVGLLEIVFRRSLWRQHEPYNFTILMVRSTLVF